jgi:hypothetical protein
VSGYAWAQPGAAPVTVPMAQPFVSIPTVAVVAAPIPGSSYVWGQPGTAPVQVPFGQP